MVSAMLCDALASPTESLVALHSSLTANGQDVDFPAKVSDHFKGIFSSKEALQQVPPLDLRHPPSAHAPRSLVRFRAMVQDTSISPDMYLSSFGDGKLGGWGLEDSATEQDLDDTRIDYDKLKERNLVWAVSVPGESDWVTECVEDPDLIHNGGTGANISPETSPRSHKHPGGPHVGALIKLYNISESLPKPTEVYTFVGILSSEPHVITDSSEEAPLWPTLHVLFSVPHPNTVVPFTYPLPQPDPAEVLSIRNELITWIAEEGLGGDKQAAEWLVLICVDKVRSRTPQLNPLPLTLSQFPAPPTSASIPTISSILSLLLPLFSHLPLSLSLLNSTSFIPEQYEEDLHSGRLQLPPGSAILVNETHMTEGKVNEKGLRNLTALKQCISSQTISYVFPFSSFSFPTDFNFIVLTEGKKGAFVDTDIIIPLQRSSTETGNLYKPAEEINLPPPAKLELFRKLLGGARVGKVTVTETMSKYIQDDFVKERQEQKGVTSEGLALRMTAAWSMALSMHETEVTKDIWERVKELDRARKSNMPLS